MKTITLENWIKNPFETLKQVTLLNGIKVYAVTGPFSEYSRACFLFPTGSYLDEDKKRGLSHFVEHTIFDENNSMLWALGEKHQVSVNGYTNFTHNWYPFGFYNEFKSFSEGGKTFSKFTDIFKEFQEILFMDSSVDEEVVRKQQKIISQEFLKSFPFGDGEYHKKVQTVPFMMFKPLGFLESIQLITLLDIQAFKKNYYRPENCTVVLVCSEPVLKEAIKCLETIPVSNIQNPLEIPVKKNFFSSGSEWSNHNWDFIKNNQVAVLNSLVHKYDNSESIMEIVETWIHKQILKELRENRKIVYGVQKDKFELQLFDVFNLQAVIDVMHLKETQDYFDYFFQNIRMSQNDFSLFKNNLVMDYTTPSIKNENEILSHLVTDLRRGKKIVTFQEALVRLQKVTLEDVNNFLDFFAQNREKSIIFQ